MRKILVQPFLFLTVSSRHNLMKIMLPKNMLKRLLIFFFVVSFFIPLQTYACGYRPYSPPGKTVKVSNLSQAFIAWKNGMEHLVIDPGLTGNAPDFGLLFAFPNKPEISEAQRAVFDELENYTLPLAKRGSFDRYYGMVAGVAPGVGSAVKVIEKKKVGDFDATVLTADTSDALLKWLKKNKYQFTNDDKDNFDYYTAQQGYYFVALKISVSDGSVKRISGEYELRPVRFTFQSPQPIFPLRLARDNDPISKFRIYAISETALIVPGTGLPFSRFIDTQEEKSSISSLLEYIDTSTWLTKLDILIDPSKIEHDLALTQWVQPQEHHSGYVEKYEEKKTENDTSSSGIFDPTYSYSNTTYDHKPPLIVEA